MVEKVFISPNRVRAYGNIINMKTGDDFTLVNSELTVTTDMVDGAEMTVFVFEVEGGISISLVSSASTCNVGDNVLLTATVIDNNTPVEAAEVTFKVGETVLGTDETDSNGVATYTYAASTAGSFTFSASYEGVSSTGVSVTVNEVAVSSVSLSSSESSISVGESVLLTANVSWNDGDHYSGEAVTFYDGNTSLGTGLTDANGVATLTASSLSVGSHSLTASAGTVTSNSVSVTVNHSYSLAFSQATYTASGGSATLEMTLLEDNVAKSGASITVTGTDSSTYTATTNSSGVASVTVTGINANTTFTATYQGATATCTVTTSSIPYQTVEYLQSNGRQYINTGYILKAQDKVEVTVSMQGTGQYNGVFGARKNDYQHNAYALFGRFGNSNKFVYTRTGQEKSGNTINTNVIYDVTTQGATCTIKQNGTLVQTLTNTGTIGDCVNPCGLFVLNTHNGTGFNKDTYGYMKIYSFKITDSNNNVIMDLVPVRDGTTGYMYDKVSNSLMTNNGTFLYGADI